MRLLATSARRVATALATLALVTVGVFALLSGLPGNALPENETGHRLPADYVAALRSEYRLDEPLAARYAAWIRDLASGDLGTSLAARRPVAEIVRERLPVSLELNAAALLAILLIATPLGIASAFKPGSRWDRLGAAGTMVLYAIPVFWMALLLQWLFAIRLDWLPLFGVSSDRLGASPIAALADRAAHLVLPVACLTYGGLAYVSRFVRATIVDAAAGDGGRAARARGVSAARYLATHGLKQAAVPLLTLLGFLLPRLVGGSLLVEEIFNVPGLGSLLFESVLARDVPVVLALTLLSGAATLVSFTLADLLAAWADPRVRRAA